MRLLVLTSPGMGHLFPTVPLAWALRAAGHEVLYASTGPGTAVARAGLPVVDIAPGADVPAFFRRAGADLPAMRSGDRLRTMPSAERLRFVTTLFAGVSRLAIDGALALAREWRPDAVLHTALQGAGPLVAGALGVPAIVHGIGFGVAAEPAAGLTAALSDDYERHGAAVPDRTASINVAPPSMSPDDEATWSMRFVPYNGDGELPPWLLRPVERPRIGVTLGTVSVHTGGLDALRHVVEAAAETDAEFVFALGEVDLRPLGSLPANVRAEGWIPLNALLASCAGLVHHGGAGTTLTALSAGVPQIVLPDGADRFRNAECVRRRGAGLELAAADVTPEVIAALSAADGPIVAAREVRAEMRAQPSPAELTTRIAEFVG